MGLYYISAISKFEKRILDVYLHETEDNGTTFLTGKWVREAEVIALIEKNAAIVRTIKWNYTKANWDYGEYVEIEKNQNKGKTLKTLKNKSVEDSLDNMIDFPKT